ncbi:MAG: hypothetical protein HY391_01155 [Deltaproteobacteria bacterium]|nr:hypothetical protein [Deltaproteobacteria bacterium]
MRSKRNFAAKAWLFRICFFSLIFCDSSFAAVHPPTKAREELLKPLSVKGNEVVRSDALILYDLDRYELLEVILEEKSPRAIVKDPMGKTHLVQKGDRLGEKMAVIGEIRQEGLLLKLRSEERGTSVTHFLPLRTAQRSKLP